LRCSAVACTLAAGGAATCRTSISHSLTPCHTRITQGHACCGTTSHTNAQGCAGLHPTGLYPAGAAVHGGAQDGGVVEGAQPLPGHRWGVVEACLCACVRALAGRHVPCKGSSAPCCIVSVAAPPSDVTVRTPRASGQRHQPHTCAATAMAPHPAYTVVGVLGAVGAFFFIAGNISKYRVSSWRCCCAARHGSDGLQAPVVCACASFIMASGVVRVGAQLLPPPPPPLSPLCHSAAPGCRCPAVRTAVCRPVMLESISNHRAPASGPCCKSCRCASLLLLPVCVHVLLLLCIVKSCGSVCAASAAGGVGALFASVHACLLVRVACLLYKLCVCVCVCVASPATPTGRWVCFAPLNR
jgi:hypothetical protein